MWTEFQGTGMPQTACKQEKTFPNQCCSLKNATKRNYTTQQNTYGKFIGREKRETKNPQWNYNFPGNLRRTTITFLFY